MGSKANPVTIGAFVVGAVVLAVAGILIFGSGQLFKHTGQYVLFFPGAVDGLNVGAPVKFKGVEIGSVKEIRIRFAEQALISAERVAAGIRIPVIIELDYDKLRGRGGTSAATSAQGMKKLIDLGLRGQLNSQSLVTGLLFVQLNFVPDAPAIFVLPPGGDLPEIPTIPTTIEQVQNAAENVFRQLQEAHIDRLVTSLTATSDSINSVVTTPELRAALQALPTTVANLNQTVTNIRELSLHLDTKAGPLLDSLKGTSDTGGVALDQARVTLQTYQNFVEPESPLSTQLSGSLQEVSDAARALRLLATYLERNPSALVRGRDVSPQ
jgi:paraquat-inducible protein B